MNLNEAIAHCRTMITKGSKSFSWAARIFNSETRDAAFCLYGWCRYCDDQIDSSDLGFVGAGSSRPFPLDSREKGGKTPPLRGLIDLTESAYAGLTMSDPVFMAFQYVVTTYQIPSKYALDLLEGMAMDVRNERYERLEDLLLYCYRVAGTVGLMMSHIMGLSHPKAFRNACDMGMAMQLTNIARDVIEDAAIGRVYLPLAWLADEGISPNDIADPVHRAALARVVARLLSSADSLYRSGDAGLKFLPLRAACAIAAARQVYSNIGNQVRSLGSRAWDRRTVISPTRKGSVMLIGLGQALGTVPARMGKFS